MLGLIILLAAASGCAIAALSILGHPGWVWAILASLAVLNTLAAGTVVLRRESGRRVALTLLAAEVLLVVSTLAVAAAVMIRDNPRSFDDLLMLTLGLFVPSAIAASAIAILAAWSINRLEWPGR